MSAGDQMRGAYDAWRAKYPRTFTRPLEVRPDGSTDPNGANFQPFHIESGVENGQPWTRVQQGYGPIEEWQKTHEIMGHMLLGLLGPGVREPFWAARFRSCQFPAPVPTSWAAAASELEARNGQWQFLPIEIFAEAARLAFDPIGPGDRSMDWGCHVDATAIRAFFDELLKEVSPAMQTNAYGVPSTNYARGREGNPVTKIVDHWTTGPRDGAIARFRNPAEIVSAHYIVGQDGSVTPMVDESDTAYHAGVYAQNLISIGIEHEASYTMPPTAELYAASAKLHADIAARHHIRLELDATVVPHQKIVATACPGTIDLARIIQEAEDDMFTDDDRAKLNRVYAHLEAYEPLVWTRRLQQWLAKAIRSVFPNADLSGPDVESGQPFKP